MEHFYVLPSEVLLVNILAVDSHLMTLFDLVRILLCLIVCTVQHKCQSRFKQNVNDGSHEIFYSADGSSGHTRMTVSVMGALTVHYVICK